jgi:hypothetical protein
MREETLDSSEKVGLLMSENADKMLLPFLDERDKLKLKLCKFFNLVSVLVANRLPFRQFNLGRNHRVLNTVFNYSFYHENRYGGNAHAQA